MNRLVQLAKDLDEALNIIKDLQIAHSADIEDYGPGDFAVQAWNRADRFRARFGDPRPGAKS